MKNHFIYLLLLGAMNVDAQTDSLLPRVYSWDSLKANKEDSRLRRQIMKGSTTSLSMLEVHASTVAPGKAPHPPHVHDDMDELLIVKEGKIRVTINNESRILSRGAIAFAIPGDMHGFENAGDSNATYYILKYKSKMPMNKQRAILQGGSFMRSWDDQPFKPSEKGGRRDFFNRSTSQLEKFEMHTTALNPGLDSHAPHTHREEEIVLILRGNVEMYIDGNLIKAVPGDLVFLPSGVSHALKNTGTVQCEYFAFQWRN
jgi:(S)-ureidoglycine aminohydrolase